MLTFLLSVHFLLAVLIIILVMIQKHESDGVLGSGGGSAGKMFSVRGQANFLTRATAVLMTLFLLNCIFMAKLVKGTPRSKSLIDEAGDTVSSQGSDRFGPFKGSSPKKAEKKEGEKTEAEEGAQKEDDSEKEGSATEGDGAQNKEKTSPVTEEPIVAKEESAAAAVPITKDSDATIPANDNNVPEQEESVRDESDSKTQ